MNIKDKLKNYLDRYLTPREGSLKRSLLGNTLFESCLYEERETNINEYIENNKEEDTFQTKLFEYIDKKELKDFQI